MTEQWPSSGSHESDAEPDLGSSSLNGADPADAITAPEASAEGIVTDQAGDQAADQAGDQAGDQAADQAGDQAADQAGDQAADQAGEPEHESESESEGAADGATFVSELVRAMQTTASVERARTGEETERRRQGHLDTIRARETAQADRIRELAADDLKAIEVSAEGEMKRIQAERKRQTTELNNDLETSLAENHAHIDREIEGVEAAISAYRAEVDAYFDGLDQETDPVAIAQQAGRRPVFPSLDVAPEGVAPTPAEPAVADDARRDDSGDVAADPTREPAVIGVMAHSAEGEVEAEPVDPWTKPAETSPDAAETSEPVGEPVGAAPGASQATAAGSLLQSVPAHRPMSWLRRDSNEGDGSKPEG